MSETIIKDHRGYIIVTHEKIAKDHLGYIIESPDRDTLSEQS